MHAIDREWALRSEISLLRRSKQVHKRHAVGLCHFTHGQGVKLQIAIQRGGIGKIGIGVLFRGYRREQNEACSRFAAVLLAESVFNELVEVLPELCQPIGSAKGLVIAEK